MQTIKALQTWSNPKIQPGETFRFSPAVASGDGVAQGDLYIMIADRVLDGYTKVESPTDLDRQLVPGNTTGAKHCIESLDTVELYWPEGWSHSLSYEGLAGPALVCHSETTILHPTHGSVVIPEGFTVVAGYQRVYDAELRRERRSMD